MIILGIFCIICGVAMIAMGISFIEEFWPIGVFVAFLGLFSIIFGVWVIFKSPDTGCKTIRCSEIQQIDTLYKNDTIVGYEIVITE